MSLTHLGLKTILVIEDDAFNIQLIRTILAKAPNLNIISSYDGTSALDTLNSSAIKIDMILLDIRMPIMDGKEFLTEMKKNRTFDDIPVLVISVDKSNEPELREMGVADFIHKPFKISDLEAKISIGFAKI